MDNPKHQKVTTYQKQPDDSIKIESKSYYDKLAHEVVEIEKHIPTTFITLKKDIEETLKHITEDKSTQLVLTVKIVNGQPRLTKKWTTLNLNYNRK